MDSGVGFDESASAWDGAVTVHEEEDDVVTVRFDVVVDGGSATAVTVQPPPPLLLAVELGRGGLWLAALLLLWVVERCPASLLVPKNVSGSGTAEEEDGAAAASA